MHDEAERKRRQTSLQMRIDRTPEGPMDFLGFVWLTLLLAGLTRALTPAIQFASVVIWIIFIFDFLPKLILALQQLTFPRRNWLSTRSLFIPAFCVSGYITATLASFFVGRDADEEYAPVAGAKKVQELREPVISRSAKIYEMTHTLKNKGA